MSWNPFQIHRLQYTMQLLWVASTYTRTHARTVANAGVMMMTMILWICRTSSNAVRGLACALCLQCVHRKKRRMRTKMKKKNNERHKMKSWKKKEWNVVVCSWLHTNNDDLKKNICSHCRRVITFFSLSSSLSCFVFFFSLVSKTTTEKSLLSVQFQAILYPSTEKKNKRNYTIRVFWHNSDRKIEIWWKLNFVHSPSKWNYAKYHLETSVCCAFVSLCCISKIFYAKWPLSLTIHNLF